MLRALLAQIGTGSRYFVEFGVGGGEQGNCVFLADWCGWHGLFIERSLPDYSSLSLKYRRNPRIRTVNASIDATNAQALFEQAGVPPVLDVLSIDIDGNDYWVWQAISRFTPRIVVIEYNANLPLDSRFVMPRDDRHTWDGTDYFGASLGAYRALGAAKGYELVHTDTTGVNAFFVRQEEAEGLPVGDKVALHEANYFGRGLGMPLDPAGRPFQEIETGRLAPAPRVRPASEG